ncbi:hypothetical protein [Phyllobacterium myrsinacearum]|uniref:Uncharacterized protein n=1 Tax=Phyllobacterium myrsinacearum TaxID=28101 RepID=A0A839EHP0_9HYPH|nr:hypothetical protein [Phyllobacterium myrsinacearum]MBA8877878.1 hypothetical protein [Phyllobacterium myrsinacearum]
MRDVADVFNIGQGAVRVVVDDVFMPLVPTSPSDGAHPTGTLVNFEVNHPYGICTGALYVRKLPHEVLAIINDALNVEAELLITGFVVPARAPSGCQMIRGDIAAAVTPKVKFRN